MVCPVLASNWPACGCEDGDCVVFDEFGMACDNCGSAGHRDTDGWIIQPEGYVWCEYCHEKYCGSDATLLGLSPPHFSIQPPTILPEMHATYGKPLCDTDSRN